MKLQTLLRFLVLALLVSLSEVAGNEKDVGGNKINNKADDEVAQTREYKDTALIRLMEMLTVVGVEFDPDTITPEQIKMLVKEQKVIAQYAKLKRASKGRKEIPARKVTIPNSRKRKSRKRSSNKKNRNKKVRSKEKSSRQRRADYSLISDPVRRGLLERISQKGIIPHAEEMSIEQLESIEEALLKGSNDAQRKEGDEL